MAGGSWTQFRYSFEKQVVDLYGRITFAGSGAPTLVSGYNKGFDSVAKVGTGIYRLHLNPLNGFYQRLLSFDSVWEQSGTWVSPTSGAGYFDGTTESAPNSVANVGWIAKSSVSKVSLGCITCTSCVAGNTLVIDGTTLTAVAYNASVTTGTWRVGNASNADRDSAISLASAINGHATLSAAGYRAISYGSIVIVEGPKRATWTCTATVLVLSPTGQMGPGGIVFVTGAATEPSSGDELRFHAALSNSAAL